MLARELLSKPDGFIFAREKDSEREYTIKDIKRSLSCANFDDSIMNWAIEVTIKDGNI